MVPIPEKRTPGPNPASRTNLEAQTPPPGLVTGVTTRTEVLLQLGEPDGRGAGDAWFTYGSVAERGGWHWYYVMIGPGFTGGPMDDWDTSRRLIVRFDEHGVVSAVSLEQKNCNAASRDCVQLGGEDLIEADRRATALLLAGPVVATYQEVQLFGRAAGCDSVVWHDALRTGAPMIVGEQGIVWQEYRKQWHGLPGGEVKAVLPPEHHTFLTWIPLQKHDGSCLFLRVLDRGVSAQQVWSAIHAHLPGAPAPSDPTH